MSTLDEDLFKDLVWDNIVKAAILQLHVIFPPIAIWPLSVISTFYLTKFTDIIYFGIKLFIDVTTIKIKNVQLRDAYNVASVKLKLIALKKGIDSDEFKQQRIKDREALSMFARYNIART